MNIKKGSLRRSRLNAIHWIALGFAGIILLGMLFVHGARKREVKL